jgi:hypothetical protein
VDKLVRSFKLATNMVEGCDQQFVYYAHGTAFLKDKLLGFG